jgi:sarcosine oxidase / L-pipecolate oxidase
MRQEIFQVGLRLAITNFPLGWLVTTCGDKAATEHLRQSYENLRGNNSTSGIEFVETPDDLIRHVPQLKNAHDISNWKGLWNKQAGWAHAQNALKVLGDKVPLTDFGWTKRTDQS